MERVFLCLDSDKAGEDACKRLAALLPDTMSVTRIQPTRKDWNEVLVHRAEIPNRDYFKSIILK
jgi:DNA primase